MGNLRIYKKGLRTLFPELDTVEGQLLNLPLILGDFFTQIEVIYLFMMFFTDLSAISISDIVSESGIRHAIQCIHRRRL